MALPSSGPLSLSQVNTELGKSATNSISLNDTNVRTLAGKASGAIAFADLRGKSAAPITFTPGPGSYSADDGGLGTSVSFTISASSAVTWTWSRTSGSGGSASIASGTSATGITFTLNSGPSNRAVTFTVNADGKTWIISLSTTGNV